MSSVVYVSVKMWKLAVGLVTSWEKASVFPFDFLRLPPDTLRSIRVSISPIRLAVLAPI